ncbi:hypothetical protein [uncultured Pseudacidovorax sp.]|uniref:hypothetical protein n=1 Tax=uncultured Pseudacidovorax sp. TaxID=679313 RepID=UPI0025E13AC9|nr:hypothetical protein [uncultured Pseudacidovorax sp.]
MLLAEALSLRELEIRTDAAEVGARKVIWPAEAFRTSTWPRAGVLGRVSRLAGP